MPLSKIKKEYASKIIAFGNRSDIPIGQRADIDDLAIMAHESKNPMLLRLFEKLPDLDVLKRTKTIAGSPLSKQQSKK